jgi:very-short-patch-repair endonuclease
MGFKRRIIPYNPELKQRAKDLRNNMTKSEVMLWNELKQGKIYGFDFDRQRCIDHFIVDFYCKDLMLAIEVDGSIHDLDEVKKKDIYRQNKLENLGITFLRFRDEDVKNDLGGVVNELKNWVNENKNNLKGRF